MCSRGRFDKVTTNDGKEIVTLQKMGLKILRRFEKVKKVMVHNKS